LTSQSLKKLAESAL